MSVKIIDALKKLDPSNDNHWTADGLPRLDTVKMLSGDQSLTRDSIVAVAPGFARATAATWEPGNTVVAAATIAQPVAPVVHVNAEISGPAVTEEVVAAVEQKSKTEIEELDALLAENRSKLEVLRAQKDKADSALTAALKEEAWLIEKRQALGPSAKQDNADAIRNYLASQVAMLDKRAQKKKMILESGVDLRELTANLRAPIDIALSGKRG